MTDVIPRTYEQVKFELSNKGAEINQLFDKLRTPFLKEVHPFLCRWNVHGGFNVENYLLPVPFRIIPNPSSNSASELGAEPIDEMKLDFIIENRGGEFDLSRYTAHYDPNSALFSFAVGKGDYELTFTSEIYDELMEIMGDAINSEQFNKHLNIWKKFFSNNQFKWLRYGGWELQDKLVETYPFMGSDGLIHNIKFELFIDFNFILYEDTNEITNKLWGNLLDKDNHKLFSYTDIINQAETLIKQYKVLARELDNLAKGINLDVDYLDRSRGTDSSPTPEEYNDGFLSMTDYWNTVGTDWKDYTVRPWTTVRVQLSKKNYITFDVCMYCGIKAEETNVHKPDCKVNEEYFVQDWGRTPWSGGGAGSFIGGTGYQMGSNPYFHTSPSRKPLSDEDKAEKKRREEENEKERQRRYEERKTKCIEYIKKENDEVWHKYALGKPSKLDGLSPNGLYEYWEKVKGQINHYKVSTTSGKELESRLEVFKGLEPSEITDNPSLQVIVANNLKELIERLEILLGKRVPTPPLIKTMIEWKSELELGQDEIDDMLLVGIEAHVPHELQWFKKEYKNRFEQIKDVRIKQIIAKLQSNLKTWWEQFKATTTMDNLDYKDKEVNKVIKTPANKLPLIICQLLLNQMTTQWKIDTSLLGLAGYIKDWEEWEKKWVAHQNNIEESFIGSPPRYSHSDLNAFFVSLNKWQLEHFINKNRGLKNELIGNSNHVLYINKMYEKLKREEKAKQQIAADKIEEMVKNIKFNLSQDPPVYGAEQIERANICINNWTRVGKELSDKGLDKGYLTDENLEYIFNNHPEIVENEKKAVGWKLHSSDFGGILRMMRLSQKKPREKAEQDALNGWTTNLKKSPQPWHIYPIRVRDNHWALLVLQKLGEGITSTVGKNKWKAYYVSSTRGNQKDEAKLLEPLLKELGGEDLISKGNYNIVQPSQRQEQPYDCGVLCIMNVLYILKQQSITKITFSYDVSECQKFREEWKAKIEGVGKVWCSRDWMV